MRLLLEVALALFAGLLMTRVFKYLKLNFPDVTAFLVAGVLVGPFVLGRLGIHGIGFNTMEDLESVSTLNNVALGFIAFDIGNEFRLAQLKETGKTATVIGVIQALMAALIVDAVLAAFPAGTGSTSFTCRDHAGSDRFSDSPRSDVDGSQTV